MALNKKLKFKLLNPKSKLPFYDHKDDAGFGIFSCEKINLNPMHFYAVSTGICSEIPKGYFVSIRDRSSMAVNGLHVMGGVIDSGYRGEWKIILINLSNNSYEIGLGDKIAQGILVKSDQAEILETKTLNETKRGEKGFGSTGR